MVAICMIMEDFLKWLGVITILLVVIFSLLVLLAVLISTAASNLFIVSTHNGSLLYVRCLSSSI